MKKGCFVFISACLVFFSCSDWIMPELLSGTWVSRQKVTVRFKEKGLGKYHFVSDSVEIEMKIAKNGLVYGKVGDARLEGCTVFQNRGEFGRMLNIKTDFIIRGKLNGNVFPQDILAEKKISMPFNLEQNTIRGSLFQKQGMDIYPMTGIQLLKN